MSVKRLGPVWFEVVKEPWNEYIIKDKADVPLKGKFVLTKLSQVKDRTKGRSGLSMSGQSIFVTYAPGSLRGKPSNPQPNPKTIPNEKKKKVDFTITKEDWNMYRLPEVKATFKVRLIVGEVYSVPGTFGPDGDLYYLVESTAIVELRKD